MRRATIRRLGLALLFLVHGCATTRKVRGEYADPNTIEVLSDQFTENDLQLIAQRLAQSLAETPHFKGRQAPARIVVGRLANKTAEGIDMESLADRMQVALFKTGKFELLNHAARQAIAREYEYQQSNYVDPSHAKGPGKQLAADYIVTGSLSSISQEGGSSKLVYYKMSMVASELSSGVVRWAEDQQIRKKYEVSGISRSMTNRLRLAGFGAAIATFAVGGGLMTAGLAHARPEGFHFEDRRCDPPFTDRMCTTTVRDPAVPPDATLLWTGGALMMASPGIALLTWLLVPEGNAHIVMHVAPSGGGMLSFAHVF